MSRLGFELYLTSRLRCWVNLLVSVSSFQLNDKLLRVEPRHFHFPCISLMARHSSSTRVAPWIQRSLVRKLRTVFRSGVSVCLFVCGKVSCGPGWPPTCYIAKASLKLLIFLPLPSKCWTTIPGFMISLGSLVLSLSSEPYTVSTMMTEKPREKKYKKNNFTRKIISSHVRQWTL